MYLSDATLWWNQHHQHAFQMFQTNLNLNFKLTTIVHYGIHLENWTAQSTTQQNEPILYKSRSKSWYKPFEILQGYFNTCISHIWHISKKILIFLLASRRTSNQLPNIATTVSPTNGKTLHNSRSIPMRKGSRSRDLRMSSPNWLHSWVLLSLRNHSRIRL